MVLVCSALVRNNNTLTGVAAGDAVKNPTKYDRQAFFIGGIGQSQQMDAAAICGGADKIVQVESQLTFGDILLGMFTAGIYTPRHSRVYCSR